MIGQTIGKYRITARLGRGGMGTVYKAVDETLEREVAIKVLNPEIADDDVLKRFRAEAITLARLNHPNIATVYDLARDDDNLLLVIEFVRGETFDKLSERLGPLPVERAVYLLMQVLDALGYAHRAGVVHRDLKPANLMLTESGVAKVMDFGIARMAGTERLTSSGYMMGTPAYMAPEQVMGDEVDGRADLYAIGVVLYRLLTGNLPFKADTAIAMVQKQIKDPPTPLKQFRAELPEWCEEILGRALAKAPGDRFQTADEFRAALAARTAPAAVLEMTTLTPVAMPAPELDVTVAPNAMPTPFRKKAEESPGPRVETPAARNTGNEPGVHPTPAEPPTKEATVTLRRSHVAFAGAAAAALLLLTVAGGFWVMWRSQAAAPAQSAPAGSAPAPAIDAQQSTTAPPVQQTPATTPERTTTPAAAAQGSAAAGPSVSPRVVPATGTPAVDTKSRPPAVSPVGRTSSTTPAPVPTTAVTPPAGAMLPSIAFSGLKLLVIEGETTREQDSELRLAGGRIEVLDRGAAVTRTVQYGDVIAVFYSRSREPRWRGPSGDALTVAKIDGGGFGFLKTDRDWVTIRTKQQFIALRPDRAIVQRVVAALEERIGRAVVRVGR